jgi:NADPH:quinone reductase-like Zn-dependent oxidoreductase
VIVAVGDGVPKQRIGERVVFMAQLAAPARTAANSVAAIWARSQASG